MSWEHLTKGASFPPGAIIGAARRDLETKKHNTSNDAPPYRPYAFHRKHVAKAEDALDLLVLATISPGLGAASGKRRTAELYSDIDALIAARDQLAAAP